MRAEMTIVACQPCPSADATMPKPSANLSDRGFVWVVTQSLLLLAVILLGVLQPGDWTRAKTIATGAVLFLVGGFFGVAGILVLGRNRTPFPRPRENSELVQHGIYARVRHPLYTSVMLSSLGWALIWQSAAAAVAALVLIPFLLVKARHEERWLRAKFPGYAEYARRVPAFVPRIRFKNKSVCCD
jgi:protein-S-isoprenylcysteine O-methyltransferase Ste14